MEEEVEIIGNVHMGRNVAKVRQSNGMKQYTLGGLLDGLTQQSISHLEQKAVIEHSILQRIAEIFKIPVDVLEKMPEDAGGVIIENNTFENVTTANLFPSVNNNSENDNNHNNTIHPINEVMDFFKQYAAEERKMREDLMNRIQNLEELIRSNKQ